MMAAKLRGTLIRLALMAAVVASTQMSVSGNNKASSSTEVQPTLPSSKILAEIQETLDLLKDGETKIVLDVDKRDVVVMLGVTGSGKSTLTQFIAGDSKSLIAESIRGIMFINDKTGTIIGTPSINSKTIYPMLVNESKTNTAFYDCPGFSDTRSPSFDIAANYFIKKVLDHAFRVKLVFTVSQSMTDLSNDREGFINLLRHACRLVTNVDKFQNSISIVVTKVENKFDFDHVGRDNPFVKDEVEIENLAEFMNNVKVSLQEPDNPLDGKNEKLSECAIKLLDIFTLKSGDKFTRIGIFRRPARPGPLSKSPLLQKGKQNIESILYEHTTYTAKDKTDFQYSIKDNSINYISNYLNKKLNDKIVASLTTLAKSIEPKFVSEYVNSEDMYAFQSQLEAVSNSLKSITQIDKFNNPMEFIEEIERNLECLRVDEEGILKDVKTELRYLEFFKGFSKSQEEYFNILQGSVGFTQAGEFITSLNNWLLVLMDLYDKHSNYQIQSPKNKYNAKDWPDSKRNVFNFDKSSVHTFLKDIAQSSGENEFKIVDDERVQRIALRDLNNIMNLAYSQYATSCEQLLETSLKELAKDIKEQYFTKGETDVTGFVGMRGLHQAIVRSYVSLERLVKTSFTTANEFKVEMEKTLKEIGISGQNAYIHIENLIKHAQLYQTFRSGNIHNIKPELWTSLLNPALEYINKLDGWYEYILSLHSELTKMSMEINTGQKNEIQETGKAVNAINMHMYVMKFKEFVPIKNEGILTDKSLSEIVVRCLNSVVNLASHLATSYDKEIVSELAKLSTEIETQFSKQCKDSNDMRSLRNDLDAGYNSLRQLLENKFSNADELNIALSIAINEMKVIVDPDTMSRISNRIKALLLLQKLSTDETIPFNPTKWLNALSPANNYLLNHLNWYTFLPDLYDKLCEYSFQKDASKYDVHDVSFWGVGSRKRGISVNRQNINTFLEKVTNLKLAGFELIKTDNIDEIVYRDLNIILEKTLQHDTISSEINGRLTIKGHFVVLSKFELEFQRAKYNSIEVFALNRIFIDLDINRIGEEFQLTIIAPIWDVQGDRKITLDGVSAKPHDQYVAEQGVDGKPGMPGANGGRFLGIGQKFLRGKSLSVSSSGGAASNGQDGGDGASYTSEFDGEFAKKSICDGSFLRYRYKLVDRTDRFFYNEWDYHIHPVVSGLARDAGNGGSEGVGGHAGKIQIRTLGTESGIDTNTVGGRPGVGGRGGIGGKGGVQTWYFYSIGTNRSVRRCWIESRHHVDEKVLLDGKNGSRNSNTRGKRMPNTPQDLSTSSYINRFKGYSEQHMSKVMTLSPLKTFYESL